MFSSLKVKNFRLYWLGMLVSLIGTWIQAVALSWLVFELTHSSFLLGLVGFLGSVPIFFLSLFGGVAADRIDKKRILLFTQCAFMLLAFILGLLTQLKLITPMQIMLIAVLNGVFMSFDAPARQAVVVELSGREHLFNAIALNSASFNSARIIGPALAGILIASIGMSGCFYINAISFLAVIVALLLINTGGAVKKEAKGFLLEDLFEGLKFIRENRVILILISMVGISSLFGISYLILMPVFAQEVFGLGAKGLGILMSSTGLGALFAALILARKGDLKHKGKILILSCIIFSLSLVAFALSKIYLLSLIILVFIGATSVLAMALINTLLQTNVPDKFRGRVMSAFMFTFAGIMPFGNLIAGALAQGVGVSLTVTINGLICVAFFSIIALKYPEVVKI